MKTIQPVTILGINIDPLTKEQALDKIKNLLKSGKKSHITTPNPEICLKAASYFAYKEIINSADLRIPDGSGLQWAARYLSKRRGFKSARYLNIPIMFIDWLYTTTRFTFSKKYKSSVIPEIIHGADLLIDIAEIAETQGLSIFFLGAKEGVAEKTAKNIKGKFPKIKIAGTYAGTIGSGNDPKVQKIINSSQADIVFAALGAPKQEKWIHKNLPELNIKLAMGVGGSFDFISGDIDRAPKAYQEKNIEWLWRLKMQPWRKDRIKNAVISFPFLVYLSKVYEYRPLRPNVLCVIIDSKKNFLILNNSYIYNKCNDSSHWQYLQGGKRPYESDAKAALRESKEEMGSSNLEIIEIADKTYSYEWPLRSLRLKRPYKGQQQKIVFIKYTGDYTDIRIDPSEHSDFKWVKKEELLQKIHHVRQPVTQIILEELDKKNILSKI